VDGQDSIGYPLLVSYILLTLAGWGFAEEPQTPLVPLEAIAYRISAITDGVKELQKHFAPSQLQILEKLNRRDLDHLARLEHVIVPESWHTDELVYSPLPAWYAWAVPYAKALVVHQPAQVFGAYEDGRLVRWGPISSGRKTHVTPSGLFHLNWRSRGRHSTVNPNWFMPWYFNFHNRRGLAFHAYTLPGYPASHACVRLLERDAQWLYRWGEGWELDARGWEVLKPGTPVLILGHYDFDAPPPWQSLDWLVRRIALPADPPLHRDPSARAPENQTAQAPRRSASLGTTRFLPLIGIP
jgi:hypothetical protein